jgi:hypothetical protein
VNLVVRGYIILHPSPHVLDNIGLPSFNPENNAHKQIARLSKRAHDARVKSKEHKLLQIEKELSTKVAELFGIAPKDLDEALEAYDKLLSLGVELDENEEVTDLAAAETS